MEFEVMKIRVNFAFCVALLVAIGINSGAAWAEPTISGHRPVDPATLDIKSIKLGMSPEQVNAIFDNLANDQADVTRYDPTADQCTRARLEALRAHDTSIPQKTPCVVRLDLGGSSYGLSVLFIEDWPAHPGAMHAYEINFSQKGLQTAADYESFAKAVKVRYGKPTFVNVLGSFYCPITPSRLNCATSYDRYYIGTTVYRGLLAGNSDIHLFNSEFAAQRRAAVQRDIDQLQTKSIKL